jgi:hypothetical protein
MWSSPVHRIMKEAQPNQRDIWPIALGSIVIAREIAVAGKIAVALARRLALARVIVVTLIIAIAPIAPREGIDLRELLIDIIERLVESLSELLEVLLVEKDLEFLPLIIPPALALGNGEIIIGAGAC